MDEKSFREQYANMLRQQKNNRTAIASLVLGIISTVCCCVWYFGCITGIAGLALGIVAFRSEESGEHGISIAGIITSSVGICLSVLSVVVVIILTMFENSSGSTAPTGITGGTGTALSFLSHMFKI